MKFFKVCIIINLFFLTFFLYACSSSDEKFVKESQKDSDYNPVDSSLPTGIDNIADDDGYASFAGHLNAFWKDEEGDIYPLAFKKVRFDEKDELVFSVFLGFETSSSDGLIPVEIYAYSEGRFLNFFTESGLFPAFRTNINENEDIELELKLDVSGESFQEAESQIALIASVDPDFLTDRGKAYEVSNTVVYSFSADTEKYRNGNSFNVKYMDEENYVTGSFPYTDIAKQSGDATSKKRYEPAARKRGEILEIDKDNSDYYFFATGLSNIKRDILVFVDGRPYPYFDGEYSRRLDFNNGSRFMACKIDGNKLPGDGKHSLQIVTVNIERTKDGSTEASFTPRMCYEVR